MRALPCRLDGLVAIEPVVHGDSRGFFIETYRSDTLRELGIDAEWQQDNHSRSSGGVIRGMHFALPPGQAKLVRCARGSVFDVCVDLRRGSPTFGQWEGFLLDDVRGVMLYIPVGFAHGYCVVSEVADFVYKCSNYYSPALERQISPIDSDLAIEWPDGPHELSKRDQAAPCLREIAHSLPFVYREA